MIHQFDESRGDCAIGASSDNSNLKRKNFDRLRKGYASVRKSFRFVRNSGNGSLSVAGVESAKLRAGQIASKLKFQSSFQHQQQVSNNTTMLLHECRLESKNITSKTTYDNELAIGSRLNKKPKSDAEQELEVRLKRAKNRLARRAEIERVKKNELHLTPRTSMMDACQGIDLDKLESITRDNFAELIGLDKITSCTCNRKLVVMSKEHEQNTHLEADHHHKEFFSKLFNKQTDYGSELISPSDGLAIGDQSDFKSSSDDSFVEKEIISTEDDMNDMNSPENQGSYECLIRHQIGVVSTNTKNMNINKSIPIEVGGARDLENEDHLDGSHSSKNSSSSLVALSCCDCSTKSDCNCNLVKPGLQNNIDQQLKIEVEFNMNMSGEHESEKSSQKLDNNKQPMEFNEKFRSTELRRSNQKTRVIGKEWDDWDREQEALARGYSSTLSSSSPITRRKTLERTDNEVDKLIILKKELTTQSQSQSQRNQTNQPESEIIANKIIILNDDDNNNDNNLNITSNQRTIKQQTASQIPRLVVNNKTTRSQTSAKAQLIREYEYENNYNDLNDDNNNKSGNHSSINALKTIYQKMYSTTRDNLSPQPEEEEQQHINYHDLECNQLPDSRAKVNYQHEKGEKQHSFLACKLERNELTGQYQVVPTSSLNRTQDSSSMSTGDPINIDLIERDDDDEEDHLYSTIYSTSPMSGTSKLNNQESLDHMAPSWEQLSTNQSLDQSDKKTLSVLHSASNKHKHKHQQVSYRDAISQLDLSSIASMQKKNNPSIMSRFWRHFIGGKTTIGQHSSRKETFLQTSNLESGGRSTLARKMKQLGSATISSRSINKLNVGWTISRRKSMQFNFDNNDNERKREHYRDQETQHHNHSFFNGFLTLGRKWASSKEATKQQLKQQQQQQLNSMNSSLKSSQPSHSQSTEDDWRKMKSVNNRATTIHLNEIFTRRRGSLGSVSSLPSADSGLSCNNNHLQQSSPISTTDNTDENTSHSNDDNDNNNVDSTRSESLAFGSIRQMSVLSRGIAKKDCNPCAYDKEALVFKEGDLIDILERDDSGTWIGRSCSTGQIGHFKFINIIEIKQQQELEWRSESVCEQKKLVKDNDDLGNENHLHDRGQTKTKDYVTKLQIKGNNVMQTRTTNSPAATSNMLARSYSMRNIHMVEREHGFSSSNQLNNNDYHASGNHCSKPMNNDIMSSLEQLLFAIGLSDCYEEEFLQNEDENNGFGCKQVSYLELLNKAGIYRLDSLSDIEHRQELDSLGITNYQHQSKILMAARIIKQASQVNCNKLNLNGAIQEERIDLVGMKNISLDDDHDRFTDPINDEKYSNHSMMYVQKPQQAIYVNYPNRQSISGNHNDLLKSRRQSDLINDNYDIYSTYDTDRCHDLNYGQKQMHCCKVNIDESENDHMSRNNQEHRSPTKKQQPHRKINRRDIYELLNHNKFNSQLSQEHESHHFERLNLEEPINYRVMKGDRMMRSNVEREINQHCGLTTNDKQQINGREYHRHRNQHSLVNRSTKHIQNNKPVNHSSLTSNGPGKLINPVQGNLGQNVGSELDNYLQSNQINQTNLCFQRIPEWKGNNDMVLQPPYYRGEHILDPTQHIYETTKPNTRKSTRNCKSLSKHTNIYHRNPMPSQTTPNIYVSQNNSITINPFMNSSIQNASCDYRSEYQNLNNIQQLPRIEMGRRSQFLSSKSAYDLRLDLSHFFS